MAVVCSDGTWMALSDVHVQTAGAWKGGETARDPGGPLWPLPARRQQWAQPETREAHGRPWL